MEVKSEGRGWKDGDSNRSWEMICEEQKTVDSGIRQERVESNKQCLWQMGTIEVAVMGRPYSGTSV